MGFPFDGIGMTGIKLNFNPLGGSPHEKAAGTLKSKVQAAF
jgi:hypothetical protein